MLVVNFIADPWEWPALRGLFLTDSHRIRRYRVFKSRLYWLLLWNDQVRILDTFALFNRQIEMWVRESRKESNTARMALEQLLGRDEAIRIALRAGSRKESFSSLAEVDEAHVRGNNHFVWYPDGPPRKTFASQLDRYLGLPWQPAPTYHASDHSTRMRDAFNSALAPYIGLNDVGYDVHAQFSRLRKLLQPDEEKQLRDYIGDQWRRSTFYKCLGFGVDRSRNHNSPKIDLSDDARELIRKLADLSYYQAVNRDLAIDCRFPGEPPTAFELFFPAHSPGSILIKEEDSLAERTELFTHGVAPIALTGEVGRLFREFANLQLQDIYQLRNSVEFTEYRSVYSEFRQRGEAAWMDTRLLRNIVHQVVTCLRVMSSKVGASIETTRSGPVRVAFSIAPIARRIVAWGISLHFPPIPDSLVDDALKYVGKKSRKHLMWLTACFHRVERGMKPLPLTVEFPGGVKTS